MAGWKGRDGFVGGEASDVARHRALVPRKGVCAEGAEEQDAIVRVTMVEPEIV